MNLYSDWVNRKIDSMNLDQKIGQLLHPFIKIPEGVDAAVKSLDNIEVGGAFFFPGTKEELQTMSIELNKVIKTPVIIASDLENGAGRMVNDAVIFPDLMAVAATDNNEYAYNIGKAAAQEGLECGIHWSFGPVVDININPNNPITNTRSFGDNPDRISRLGKKVVQGMQDNGLVSCAKHFPGDGFDDRDQHLCTTINPLSMDEWRKTSGKMFKDMIDCGVLSIMTGHISLPSYDPGDGKDLRDAPPAVMSYKLTTELLRKEMGFEGVIITDAIKMGGSITRCNPQEAVIRSLEAGNDMILFCDTRKDFDAIKDSAISGRLKIENIEMSARRILALKEKLNLNTDNSFAICPPDDKKAFKQISKNIASDALTVVQNRIAPSLFPLKKGMKVLAYHLRGDVKYNVNELDQKLIKKGLIVDHFDETEEYPAWDLSSYDVILIFTVFGPNWGTNRIRMNGPYCRPLWRMLGSHPKRLLMFSFGSPYLIYDCPEIPFYANAYSPDDSSQCAVVDFLMGELEAKGTSPVDLDKLFSSYI